MDYFIISNYDGETSIEKLTKEKVLKRLDPKDPYYGDKKCLSSISDENNPNHWSKNLLIIKGEIVTPIAKEVILSIDID
jgi:hypothetical protein